MMEALCTKHNIYQNTSQSNKDLKFTENQQLVKHEDIKFAGNQQLVKHEVLG